MKLQLLHKQILESIETCEPGRRPLSANQRYALLAFLTRVFNDLESCYLCQACLNKTCYVVPKLSVKAGVSVSSPCFGDYRRRALEASGKTKSANAISFLVSIFNPFKFVHAVLRKLLQKY